MCQSDNSLQILKAYICCTVTRIEFIQATIHGIGPCGNCRFYRINIPTRCQQFNSSFHGCKYRLFAVHLSYLRNLYNPPNHNLSKILMFPGALLALITFGSLPKNNSLAEPKAQKSTIHLNII